MTLILSAVCLSGVVASKLLLGLGVTQILVRYPLAVLLSYLTFFLLIRLWLLYVSPPRPATAKQKVDRSSIDLDLSQVDLIDAISTAADVNAVPAEPVFGPTFGGGGDFGGAGATDYWGETTPSVVPRVSSSSISTGGSGGKSSSGGFFDLDLGDEGIVLILFLLLLLIIFGAGAWLVWQAPVILSEAAFEALLVSGLVKASNRIERGNWIGSIFRATFFPFAIVMAMTLIFSAAAHHYCPDAVKLPDIFHGCPSD
jgi:hypothetical protein